MTIPRLQSMFLLHSCSMPPLSAFLLLSKHAFFVHAQLPSFSGCDSTNTLYRVDTHESGPTGQVDSFGSQNKTVPTANRVMGPREGDEYMESYASCLCNGDFMECIGHFHCRGLLLTALQNMPPHECVWQQDNGFSARCLPPQDCQELNLHHCSM